MLRQGDHQRRLATLAALLLAGAMLAGCSGDDDDPQDSKESTSGTPSESASPALELPDGVELTPEGTELGVGETATVAYEPRQGEVGVLDITVTRLEKTSFKDSFEGWDLDAGAKTTKPYFVRATVVNRGTTDLAGRRVQLYIVDGTNTLVEATSFASAFKPCNPGAFPTPFPPGAELKACLVFLSPDKGDLTAVSFRPTQDYVPITWTGELQEPKPDKPKKPKNKDDKG